MLVCVSFNSSSGFPLVALQKWSKGKMKEKVNNQVLFDKVSISPKST